MYVMLPFAELNNNVLQFVTFVIMLPRCCLRRPSEPKTEPRTICVTACPVVWLMARCGPPVPTCQCALCWNPASGPARPCGPHWPTVARPPTTNPNTTTTTTNHRYHHCYRYYYVWDATMRLPRPPGFAPDTVATNSTKPPLLSLIARAPNGKDIQISL